jgi:hypothetical protein
MDAMATFCRQLRARSAEHRQAVFALRGLPGQTIAVLRQELDSLVRIVFLLSQPDRAYRQCLLEAAVSGTKWTKKGTRKHITDRDMVDLTNTLHGWTHSVYAFGCAFIHLSHFHDYRVRDPLQRIPDYERNALLTHLRNYHGGPHGATPTFAEIVPFLPAVFIKIADNLECYIRQLENNEDIGP